MKYIIVLADGMADRPLRALGGKTPMQAANTPNMDAMAGAGVMGMAHTIPQGMAPGSDTANLSVMGYDPKKYYTGRSPLEAASIGVDLGAEDVTYRMNFVTLGGDGPLEARSMDDYCAGEISTGEADALVCALREKLCEAGVELYTGVSYRHCLALRDAQDGTALTPPHDISLQPVRGHLPRGGNAALLTRIMEGSLAVLHGHPVNRARVAAGKHPANAVWFWGEGRKPALDSFYSLYGLRGAVISAVDLIRGIARCAGMDVITVPGATGNIDTNFEGKGDAAIAALHDHDFVYVHVEAPDECGHRGEAENKTRAIEFIDEYILGRLIEESARQPLSIMVLPDHPTPVELRTHTADAVPFAFMRSGCTGRKIKFCEENAQAAGIDVESGPALLKKFLGRE